VNKRLISMIDKIITAGKAPCWSML
jgi:hypothetical protein